MLKTPFLRIAALAILGFAGLGANAQVSFNHSIGAAYYLSDGAEAPAILYSPRLNVVELGRELTISVGTHLGLGFQKSASSDGSSSGSFAIDIPLMAEMNFGHAANPDTRSGFGGFIGAGVGYNQMSREDEFSGSIEKSSTTGLVFNAGIRTIISDNPCGLRLSFMKGLKESDSYVVGAAIFYTLGDF